MNPKKPFARRNEANETWPRPEFDEHEQPHFLFILTPPFSGSTALAKLLNTSNKTVFLHPRGEGQWLVPGLSESDRWNPDKYVDYGSVRAVWLRKYQEVKNLVGGVNVVIEKSPPNMMRIENIAAMFRDFSFVANNRNPYANCSSILHRNHPATKMGEEERIDLLTGIAEDWVMRSAKLEELIGNFKIPLLTYEQFCNRPDSILEKLDLPDEVIASIDTGAEVQVKDYPPQHISNQNERQISRLSAREINEISVVLSGHLPSLEYFGYEILER